LFQPPGALPSLPLLCLKGQGSQTLNNFTNNSWTELIYITFCSPSAPMSCPLLTTRRLVLGKKNFYKEIFVNPCSSGLVLWLFFFFLKITYIPNNLCIFFLDVCTCMRVCIHLNAALQTCAHTLNSPSRFIAEKTAPRTSKKNSVPLRWTNALSHVHLWLRRECQQLQNLALARVLTHCFTILLYTG